MGGVKAIFEFANGLQRLGHAVNLVHFQFAGHSVDEANDIGWFDIDPGVRQLFVREGDGQTVPDADFIFPYHAVFPRELGLPLNLVQGYRMMPPDMERALYVAPCPKVCIAKWLVGVGRDLGVPDEQLVYVPNGIDHSTFRLVHPVEGRDPIVAMLYHSHAMKGTQFGLEALVQAKTRVPEMSVVLFGTREVPPGLPPWMHAVKSPSAETLVSDIYNGSRVFVCPSIVEGFGLPSIEAMAGGCALVTTDNGGSHDFAIAGESALVSEPKDVAALADNIVALLTDDALRLRLAHRGLELVRAFDWGRSSELLADFLAEYGAAPERYGYGQPVSS